MRSVGFSKPVRSQIYTNILNQNVSSLTQYSGCKRETFSQLTKSGNFTKYWETGRAK